MNIKLLSFCIFLSTATMANNYQFGDFARHPASADSCQLNGDTPLLFNVVKNSAEEIVVETGDFKEFFGLSKNELEFTVHINGIHDIKLGPKYVPKQVEIPMQGQNKSRTTIDASKDIIRVPVTETGSYVFRVSMPGASKPFWIQKIFAVAKGNLTIPEEKRVELAKKYAPIISFADNEDYYPVSLDYLVNKIDTDASIGEEDFKLSYKAPSAASSGGGFLGGLFGDKDTSNLDLDLHFKFKNIMKVLPFFGHHEAVMKYDGNKSSDTGLKKRFGKNNVTVYYSFFENVIRNEVIINYHFFYPYDAKNGTLENDALPAHIWDRESISVILRKSSLNPIHVFYGAHLPSQTMALLSPEKKIIERWNGGRVYLNWLDKVNPEEEAPKLNERPFAVAAYGSHGMYPIKGDYAVVQGNIKLLTETAGGKKRFIHPDFETNKPIPESLAYKLEDLKLNSVTSTCKDSRGILAFSGSPVDVLGPVNATFPPYTDREENFMGYADPNAWKFNFGKSEIPK